MVSEKARLSPVNDFCKKWDFHLSQMKFEKVQNFTCELLPKTSCFPHYLLQTPHLPSSLYEQTNRQQSPAKDVPSLTGGQRYHCWLLYVDPTSQNTVKVAWASCLPDPACFSGALESHSQFLESCRWCGESTTAVAGLRPQLDPPACSSHGRPLSSSSTSPTSSTSSMEIPTSPTLTHQPLHFTTTNYIYNPAKLKRKGPPDQMYLCLLEFARKFSAVLPPGWDNPPP